VGATESERGLAKKALRTLFLAGMFGDLPDEGQVHPGMQARVKRQLPEMEQAVYEMADYLENISDEDAEQLQGFLKGVDNPAMELAEWLDVEEGSLGVSRKRRLQTRAMVTHVVSRLKNQPPEVLFDEYIGKVERVDARTGTVEEQKRRMIARMGEDAFWQRQQRLAMYVAAWDEGGVTAEDFPMDDLPPIELPEPPEEPPEEPAVAADAGVEPEPSVEDAGVGPEPAPVAQPQPAPQPQPPLRPSDPSALSCAGLDEERTAVRAARLRNEIADTEYKDRLAELRVHRVRKQCDGVKEVESPLNTSELTSDKCSKVIKRAKRDLNSLRSQQRSRSITRGEVRERSQVIRSRSDLRYCQKQKKRRAGLVSLGIGGAAGVAAVVMIAVGAGFESGLGIAGMFVATPAVVLLILGLVMLGGAARMRV